MERIQKDSELLRKFELIDYSMFLVEVDRTKKLRSSNQQGLESLVYDVQQQQFVMKVI